MNNAYLLLGSNEGDRVVWLRRAMELIDEHCGKISARSSIYETAAWGITAQPDFLNMVISLETNLLPALLLHTLLGIENTLGRHRTIKWGPRTIDIDILLYNSDIVDTPALVIPHPFLQERRFTLEPLAELAPDYVHPLFQKSITVLLAECPDKLTVWKYSPEKK